MLRIRIVRKTLIPTALQRWAKFRLSDPPIQMSIFRLYRPIFSRILKASNRFIAAKWLTQKRYNRFIASNWLVWKRQNRFIASKWLVWKRQNRFISTKKVVYKRHNRFMNLNSCIKGTVFLHRPFWGCMKLHNHLMRGIKIFLKVRSWG